MSGIVIAIRNFYPDVGGSQRQAQRLAAALAARGIRVTLLTGRTPFRLAAQDSCQYRVVRLWYPQIRFIGTAVYILRLILYLVRHSPDYDIILSFMLKHTSFASIIAGGLIGKPVLVRPAGGGIAGDIAFLKKAFLGSWCLSISRRASACISLSREISAELVRNGFRPERIFEIPNGVEVPEEFDKPLEERKKAAGLADRKVATFVGRLSPEKGLGLLIEAWKGVLRAFPDALLFLVGTGALKEQLEREVITSGLGESVKLAGETENVGRYLSLADIFVLPSESEGMPVALLEAMAHGLACVASRVGAVPEIIESEKTGIIVPPRKRDALETAIIRLFESPHLCRRFGENARRAVIERFSLERMAEGYLELFERILREGKKVP